MLNYSDARPVTEASLFLDLNDLITLSMTSDLETEVQSPSIFQFGKGTEENPRLLESSWYSKQLLNLLEAYPRDFHGTYKAVVSGTEIADDGSIMTTYIYEIDEGAPLSAEALFSNENFWVIFFIILDIIIFFVLAVYYVVSKGPKKKFRGILVIIILAGSSITPIISIFNSPTPESAMKESSGMDELISMRMESAVSTDATQMSRNSYLNLLLDYLDGVFNPNDNLIPNLPGFTPQTPIEESPAEQELESQSMKTTGNADLGLGAKILDKIKSWFKTFFNKIKFGTEMKVTGWVHDILTFYYENDAAIKEDWDLMASYHKKKLNGLELIKELVPNEKIEFDLMKEICNQFSVSKISNKHLFKLLMDGDIDSVANTLKINGMKSVDDLKNNIRNLGLTGGTDKSVHNWLFKDIDDNIKKMLILQVFETILSRKGLDQDIKNRLTSQSSTEINFDIEFRESSLIFEASSRQKMYKYDVKNNPHKPRSGELEKIPLKLQFFLKQFSDELGDSPAKTLLLCKKQSEQDAIQFVKWNGETITTGLDSELMKIAGTEVILIKLAFLDEMIDEMARISLGKTNLGQICGEFYNLVKHYLQRKREITPYEAERLIRIMVLDFDNDNPLSWEKNMIVDKLKYMSSEKSGWSKGGNLKNGPDFIKNLKQVRRNSELTSEEKIDVLLPLLKYIETESGIFKRVIIDEDYTYGTRYTEGDALYYAERTINSISDAEVEEIQNKLKGEKNTFKIQFKDSEFRVLLNSPTELFFIKGERDNNIVPALDENGKLCFLVVKQSDTDADFAITKTLIPIMVLRVPEVEISKLQQGLFWYLREMHLIDWKSDELGKFQDIPMSIDDRLMIALMDDHETNFEYWNSLKKSFIVNIEKINEIIESVFKDGDKIFETPNFEIINDENYGVENGFDTKLTRKLPFKKILHQEFDLNSKTFGKFDEKANYLTLNQLSRIFFSKEFKDLNLGEQSKLNEFIDLFKFLFTNKRAGGIQGLHIGYEKSGDFIERVDHLKYQELKSFFDDNRDLIESLLKKSDFDFECKNFEDFEELVSEGKIRISFSVEFGTGSIDKELFRTDLTHYNSYQRAYYDGLISVKAKDKKNIEVEALKLIGTTGGFTNFEEFQGIRCWTQHNPPKHILNVISHL